MNTKGITLIELLVVVVLIVFLAALLISPTMGQREKPRQVKCAGNLKQIGMALHTYAADHGDKFPVATGIITGDASSNTHELAMESLAMLYPHYVPDGRLFVCPSADSATAIEQNLDTFPISLLNEIANKEEESVAEFQKLFGSKYTDYGFDPTHTAAHKAGVAIAADRPNANVRDNSPNHALAGQNVLYVDGSVSWQRNTNCGIMDDEIYDMARPAGMTNDKDNSNIK